MGQLCSCVEPRRHKLKRERRLSDGSTQNPDVAFDNDSDDDEIRILIDGDGDGDGNERDALLMSAVITKRTSKALLLRMQSTPASGGASASDVGESLDTLAQDPRSAVDQRRNLEVLRSYQQATGVVDPGQHELECVMCLDTFGRDNPKVRTLCHCGMNRTNFHLSCLLEWLNRDANCPVCRQYLFYEEP